MTTYLRWPLLLAGFGLVLAGCDEGPTDATEATPRFAASQMTCDFKDAKKAAVDWFPGKGAASTERQATDVVDAAQDACELGQSDTYTNLVLDMGVLIEAVLEERNPENGGAGDAARANFLLQDLITKASPSGGLLANFCGTVATDCEQWEGFDPANPFANPPDFTVALSHPDGMFAVIGPFENAATVDINTADPVCSGFPDRSPCANISGLEDVVGFTPANSWDASLRSLRSILFGGPTTAQSPTGEVLLDADLSAYQATLLPRQVFPDGEGLIYGQCTLADAGGVAEAIVVQRNTVGTTRASIGDWCDLAHPHAQAEPTGFLGRLAATVRSLVAPKPLYANYTVINALGGGIGATSDFFTTVMNTNAVVEFLNQPVDGIAGKPIVDIDGNDLVVRTRTDLGTPLERVLVTISQENQNANPTSGLSLTSPNLDNCDTGDADPLSCTTVTAGDASVDPLPGEAVLTGLSIDKTGQHKLCLTAALDPFTFVQVCSDTFVLNP